MKQKTIFLLLIIIISASCNNNETENTTYNKKIEFTEFPETVQVKGEKRYFKENIQIYEIYVIDDILITINMWIDRGSYINYYNKNTLEHIGSTAKRGKGPAEIIMGSYPSVDTKNNKIYFCDNGRNRQVYEYDIEKSIKNSTYKPKEMFQIGMNKLNLEGLTYCNKNLFMYYYYSKDENTTEYLYTFVNEKGELINNNIKSNKNKLPTGARKRLGFRKDIFKNNKIFTAYNFQDKILCFDTKQQKLVFEIRGPLLEEPEIELHGDNWVPFETPSAITYLSITASNKYIYALYSGVYETIQDRAPIGTNTIFIFDYEGNPLKKLEVNAKMQKIILDEQTNTIIGVSNDDKTGTHTQALIYIKLDGILD